MPPATVHGEQSCGGFPLGGRETSASLLLSGRPPAPFAIPALEKPLEISVLGGSGGEPKAMYDLSTAFLLTTTHSVYATRYSTRRAELRRFPFGRKGNLRSSAPLWSSPPPLLYPPLSSPSNHRSSEGSGGSPRRCMIFRRRSP